MSPPRHKIETTQYFKQIWKKLRKNNELFGISFFWKIVHEFQKNFKNVNNQKKHCIQCVNTNKPGYNTSIVPKIDRGIQVQTLRKQFEFMAQKYNTFSSNNSTLVL